jgi:hypothetical protein
LDEDRFFTGRERELGILALLLEAWCAGRVANCAVAGEDGSGRTTLLQMAKRSLMKDEEVIQLTLTETILDESVLASRIADEMGIEGISDFQSLESHLLNGERRVIVIVENIQQLYLRVIDGFETLEQFLLFVSRTGEKVLWILSSAWHSWQYLNRVLNVEGYLQRVIKLDTLSAEDVRAIISRRHTVSGFHRVYVPTQEDKRMRRFKRAKSADERRQIAEELFFQRLQSVAAGNVAVALLFYLRAVTKVKGDTLFLTTEVKLDEAALSGLSMEERFTMAAVLMHSGLSVEEHSRVFRQPLNGSHRVLLRLKHMGVLVKSGEVFHLHKTVLRLTQRALHEANVLH